MACRAIFSLQCHLICLQRSIKGTERTCSAWFKCFLCKCLGWRESESELPSRRMAAAARAVYTPPTAQNRITIIHHIPYWPSSLEPADLILAVPFLAERACRTQLKFAAKFAQPNKTKLLSKFE